MTILKNFTILTKKSCVYKILQLSAKQFSKAIKGNIFDLASKYFYHANNEDIRLTQGLN